MNLIGKKDITFGVETKNLIISIFNRIIIKSYIGWVNYSVNIKPLIPFKNYCIYH